MASVFQREVLLLSCIVSLAIISSVPAQDELYQIAESVASPVFTSYEAAVDGLGDDAVMLRQELAYQQLSQLSSTNAQLDTFRRNRLSDYSACNQSLRELRRLDSNVPDFEGLVTKTLAASPALYKTARANYDGKSATYSEYDHDSVSELAEKAITEVIRAGYNAYQASEERTNYRNRYRKARANALVLEEIVRTQIKSPALTHYGIGCVLNFTEDGRSVTVGSLLDGSPAAKAGLRAGDKLISADGKLLTRDSFPEVMGVRTSPQTVPIQLVASRNGSTRTYSVDRNMPIVLPLLNVDVNGSFDGFYSSDFAFVTNVSGQDLTNVLLFVDLKGKHGANAVDDSDHHLHCVKNWGKNETRVLRYMSTSASGIASNESVDQLTNLQFRIYSDQFTQTENCIYTAEAFTEDVERYVTDLQLTAKWYSYSNDHLLYNSGVTIKTANGTSFPATAVTITVSSGVQSKSFKYNIGNDVFDGEEYFSHVDFNGMTVDRIDVSFHLPYTDHTIDVYWTL